MSLINSNTNHPDKDRPAKVELKVLFRANNCDYAIWQFEEPWVRMAFPLDASTYERPVSWLTTNNGIEIPGEPHYNFVLEAYTGGLIYFGVTLQECLDFLPKSMRKQIQEITYA